MRILQGISNTNIYMGPGNTSDGQVWAIGAKKPGNESDVTSPQIRIQTKLAPIRTLETFVQCELVATRKMSLNEMKDESSKKKQVTALKSQVDQCQLLGRGRGEIPSVCQWTTTQQILGYRCAQNCTQALRRLLSPGQAFSRLGNRINASYHHVQRNDNDTNTSW